MTVLGGHFDIVVLVVAAVALLRRARLSGCAVGFAAGFLLDLLSGATMGASSLVLTAVGYGVGRFRELRDPSHGLMPLAVGAAGHRPPGCSRSPPCRSCSTSAPR